MPKTMTKSESKNSMTFLWVLVVLLILTGLYFYKVDKYSRSKMKAITPEEAMIKNADDLEEEGMQLDKTDVDAQLDSGLNLLQEDANQIQ